MKSAIARRWFCFAFSCLFITAALAVTPTAPESRPDVKLAGITALFGDKRALLSVQEGGAKYSCTLSEGQASGDIEVLQIDEASGRVLIRNGDQEEELTFSRNGVPTPATSCATPRSYSYTHYEYTHYESSPVYPAPQPVVVYASPPSYTYAAPQSQFILLRGANYPHASFSSYSPSVGGGSRVYGSSFRCAPVHYGTVTRYIPSSYSSRSYCRPVCRSVVTSCRAPVSSCGRTSSCGVRSCR
jgi:hypothetical protein